MCVHQRMYFTCFGLLWVIFLFFLCREKVSIPKSKEYIMLEGEGSDQTWIEWGDYANDGQHTTASSATFSCYASNFMARDISFKVPFSLHF